MEKKIITEADVMIITEAVVLSTLEMALDTVNNVRSMNDIEAAGHKFQRMVNDSKRRLEEAYNEQQRLEGAHNEQQL